MKHEKLSETLNGISDRHLAEAAQAKGMSLPEDTVLVLASTVYYRAKWVNEFSESKTEKDIFHAPTGDITCDFMHRT